MYLIKLINYSYIIFSVLLYLILFRRLDPNFSSIYLINILSFISYYFVLRIQLFKSEQFYTKIKLLQITFFYNLFFITFYKILSYTFNKNFFVFSEADAGTYHVESLKMISMSFSEGIDYFLSKYTFEDLGAVLVISTLYRVIESNLFVNVLYLFLSIFTGLGLFKIGQYLMPKRFAFFSSLTFSISSYFMWHNSSGLKESIMVFLVVQCFLNYYNFIKLKKPKNIIYLIMFLLSLMLFRPAVMFLIIGALLLGYVLSRKKNVAGIILTIILFIIVAYSEPYITLTFNKFFGGSVDQMISGKETEGMIKGSVYFTYFVNVLAGLIGPFPTLLPNEKTMLSIFAPGLIYKILISIPFLFGVVYIFMKKKILYYPLAIFVLLEITSLVFILEALELRKSLPHFPFIYLISFGYISFFARGEISKTRRRAIMTFFNFSFLLVFFLILYWNFR
jgi:hypothetical protein